MTVNIQVIDLADNINSAFDKVNENFAELDSAVSGFSGLSPEDVTLAVQTAVDGLPPTSELVNQNIAHNPVKIWTGSQLEYNQVSPIDPDTLYFIL